ncbi:similar to Saccharomyces cerevisiae YKL192C ACP1 Mitochondrial matrix acyl carrier protein, involved in biosynthesis of octanoate, which is a precursor to lipoic acid [Maudiozyma barnettii]|uniref:Acyl carrier protein n=1 Tax=Maudiozyma barnettii TaxID=61262 RepID=A0A8H2VK19_9SACH|nr:acyl carrier protein [Kazachstania barnettii]CAB4257000.1 similar to Saccharomyces cerevisiae YKL192C ACP1 Mitochondrial matrix acyl carrier protein, involved in biosynthesis of octanoate, which is a precursor to lipoic acid [Kazachstania barnettii]CAD1779371.1 similar to Saccharomyces cerevisiae YKL192C ACP1 Mitochondrial matrix acyl carrier protein, involved in biosynthesis of octanoate, which is a precursor to lipoic acid [Kazachstania barnettii]
MFRSVITRCANPIVKRQLAASSKTYPMTHISARFYSPPSTLEKGAITSRMVDLLKTFNKSGNTEEITETASFQKDLGLDSLDLVEFIVAVEEEFSIEIPDKIADDLKTIGQTVEYIKDETDAS